MLNTFSAACCDAKWNRYDVERALVVVKGRAETTIVHYKTIDKRINSAGADVAAMIFRMSAFN